MKETRIPTVLLAEALWRRHDQPSFDHCRLVQLPDAFVIGGVLLTVSDGRPIQVHYNVFCGMDWTTRAVHVQIVQGDASRRLELRRDPSGEWWRDDERLPVFDGLSDIDLAFTPATNTLPIRRLGLKAGEAASTDAVWVRFPELTIERLPQRYVRIDGHCYTYESRGGSFTADLIVDDQGVVITYGDIWERVVP
jgi:hypothetical protein